MTVCLSVCRRPHGPSVMGQTAWTAEVDSVCRQGIRSVGDGGGECGGGEEREGEGLFRVHSCGTSCVSCSGFLYEARLWNPL